MSTARSCLGHDSGLIDMCDPAPMMVFYLVYIYMFYFDATLLKRMVIASVMISVGLKIDILLTARYMVLTSFVLPF